MSALPENDQESRADERLERRHEHAPGADQTDVARDIFPVRAVESANLGFFLHISAHHAHAGEIFLHAGSNRGEGCLNFLVEVVNRFPEEPDGHRDDGRGQQNPKRQRRRKQH